MLSQTQIQMQNAREVQDQNQEQNLWEDLLSKYDAHMRISTTDFAAERYREIVSIKNSDPIIKAIPIVENNEKFVDIVQKNNPRITMWSSMPINKRKKLSYVDYTKFKNASQIRSSVYNLLENATYEIDDMVEYFGYTRGKIIIVITEAYRHLDAQQELFNKKTQEIQETNPHFTEDDLHQETCFWISHVKDNVPPHSTGGAIDCTLYDTESSAFLDMGRYDCIMDDNPEAFTFSRKLTAEQIKNRIFLFTVLTNAGFVNNAYKFWHYEYGTQYWAHHQKKEGTKAFYGSVEDPIDPFAFSSFNSALQ